MPPRPQQLFRSAVAGYARYRTGYPEPEVARLAERLGLDRTSAVVDIGCGTGQLARPMARHAGTVVAIDPVAEMLAVGEQSARAEGIDNISWRLGDSSTLEALVDRGARAATFAASFHWTDRPGVLRTLDRLLDADGSVVVIDDDRSDDEDPDWARAVNDVRRRYLDPDTNAGYRKPVESHCSVLERSAFSRVDSLLWEWSRVLSVDDAVGLQFTYSFSTPELFGDRAAAFAHDARAAILRLHPGGEVTEPFRVRVLVASRD